MGSTQIKQLVFTQFKIEVLCRKCGRLAYGNPLTMVCDSCSQ